MQAPSTVEHTVYSAFVVQSMGATQRGGLHGALSKSEHCAPRACALPLSRGGIRHALPTARPALVVPDGVLDVDGLKRDVVVAVSDLPKGLIVLVGLAWVQRLDVGRVVTGVPGRRDPWRKRRAVSTSRSRRFGSEGRRSG